MLFIVPMVFFCSFLFSFLYYFLYKAKFLCMILFSLCAWFISLDFFRLRFRIHFRFILRCINLMILLAIVSLFISLIFFNSLTFVIHLIHTASLCSLCVLYGPIALTLKKKNYTIMLSILFYSSISNKCERILMHFETDFNSISLQTDKPCVCTRVQFVMRNHEKFIRPLNCQSEFIQYSCID